MIFILTFAGLSVAGSLLLVHAACYAPEGHEDDHGFHFAVSRHPEITENAQHTVEHGGLSVVGR